MLYEERVIRIIHWLKFLMKILYFLRSIFFGVSNILFPCITFRSSKRWQDLKEILRKKRVDYLPNLNLFIERVEKRDRTINSCYFFDDSESYFEKLFPWKIEKEDFSIQTKHFIQQRRHKKVYGKPLRKPIMQFFMFFRI